MTSISSSIKVYAYLKPTIGVVNFRAVSCTGLYITGKPPEAVKAVIDQLSSLRQQFPHEATPPEPISLSTYLILPSKASEEAGFSKAFLSQVAKVVEFTPQS